MNTALVYLRNAGILVLLAIGALLGVSGMTDIDPGEVGIKICKVGCSEEAGQGTQNNVLGTGLFWVNPITYDVWVYDVRHVQHEFEALLSSTADGQPIEIESSLETWLEDDLVPILHESYGPNYFEQVVWPAYRSAVRNFVPTKKSDQIYIGKSRQEVQDLIQNSLNSKLNDVGIYVAVNLRDLRFMNSDFVQKLEEKAKEDQNIEIEMRKATAAENIADRMETIADGEKRERIKKAEADREEKRLAGEGLQLQREAEAKGNLALAQAEAEGRRLMTEALKGPGGQNVVSIEWAQQLGPNVQVLGYPLGAEGTTGIFNVDGILGDALKIRTPGGE